MTVRDAVQEWEVTRRVFITSRFSVPKLVNPKQSCFSGIQTITQVGMEQRRKRPSVQHLLTD